MTRGVPTRFALGILYLALNGSFYSPIVFAPLAGSLLALRVTRARGRARARLSHIENLQTFV